jgi:preprotein translocase subunit SecG
VGGGPYKRSITVVLIIFIINVVIFDLYSSSDGKKIEYQDLFSDIFTKDRKEKIRVRIRAMVFNATFNNISVISWGGPYKRSITVVLIIFIINVVIFDLYSAVHRNVLINYPLQEKPSLL